MATINASERLNAILLIIRLAIFAVAAAFATETGIHSFTLLAAIAIGFAITALRYTPALLPYAFLLATALWGGVTAALLFSGEGPVPSALAAMLALTDGVRFVLIRCRP